jgi:hypothetical protein
LAGAGGIGPTLTVLETVVLPLYDAPTYRESLFAKQFSPILSSVETIRSERILQKNFFSVNEVRWCSMKRLLVSVGVGAVIVLLVALVTTQVFLRSVELSQDKDDSGEGTPVSGTTPGTEEVPSTDGDIIDELPVVKWANTVILNEGVRATVDLPQSAFATIGTQYRWTLPEAYLEKSRSMKLELFTQSTVFNEKGCMISNDIERITEESMIMINGASYCVVTGLSVGAGQVYRTTVYTKADHTHPFALAFTIHYAGDVHVYGGCETDEDAKKKECIAREFHEEQDTQLFKDIMETLRVRDL